MSLQIGKVFSQNKNSFPEDDWISNWRKWNPRISHSNKKVYQNYKKESLDLSPKNSEVFSATSMSGSSKKETKMLKTISNPRKILKVIQIIHWEALQTTLILVYMIPGFNQIIWKY